MLLERLPGEPEDEVVSPFVIPRAEAGGRRLKPDRLLQERFPRGLIFCWCCFLLAGWLAQFATWDGSAAARWMLMLGMVGFMVMWPAVRLSYWAPHPSADGGRRARQAARRVMYDWLALQAVFQLVIWPLSLIGGWSLGRLLAILGLLVGWSLWTGRVMVAGLLTRSSAGRVLAMAGCLAVGFAPLLVMVVWVVFEPYPTGPRPLVWLWLEDLNLPGQLWGLSRPIEDMLEPWRWSTMISQPGWLVLPGAILAWLALLLPSSGGKGSEDRLGR